MEPTFLLLALALLTLALAVTVALFAFPLSSKRRRWWRSDGCSWFRNTVVFPVTRTLRYIKCIIVKTMESTKQVFRCISEGFSAALRLLSVGPLRIWRKLQRHALAWEGESRLCLTKILVREGCVCSADQDDP